MAIIKKNVITIICFFLTYLIINNILKPVKINIWIALSINDVLAKYANIIAPKYARQPTNSFLLNVLSFMASNSIIYIIFHIALICNNSPFCLILS